MNINTEHFVFVLNIFYYVLTVIYPGVQFHLFLVKYNSIL